MRKEVKRARVLIISKMAEQVASLKKKKKGQESEVKESQEKAVEIMKEIKSLRRLKLDQVTKTALQENVDLEKVLQDPQASPVDRAIAHIATHSRFINKLQKVKEAIKEERAKAAEAEQKKTDKPDTVQSMNEDEEPEEDEESEEEPEENEEPEEEPEKDKEQEDDLNSHHSEEDGDVVEEKLNSPTTEIHTSSVAEPTESTDSDLVKLPPSKIITTSPEKSKRVEVKSQKAEATAPNVKSYPEKSSTVSKKNIGKVSEEMETTLKSQKKKDLPETKKVEAEKDNEESDLSDEEEEKNILMTAQRNVSISSRLSLKRVMMMTSFCAKLANSRNGKVTKVKSRRKRASFKKLTRRPPANPMRRTVVNSSLCFAQCCPNLACPLRMQSLALAVTAQDLLDSRSRGKVLRVG